MNLHHFARRAMGCDYEIWLAMESETQAAQLAFEAWDEVHRLEHQLSLYQPDSDLTYLNHHAAQEPVRVEPGMFDLLMTCKQIWEETGGAFDPTITPLLRLWGFVNQQWRLPSENEIRETMEKVGMEWVLLEPEDRWVYYAIPGIELSLGAVGKGYAIARIARLLREYGLESALLSAGGSTIYALGTPPDSEGWQVGIRDPEDAEKRLETLTLCDTAFSTSGSYEQFFEVDGTRYAHILDPRTGYPATDSTSVSVVAPDPVVTDALSTAFFVGGAVPVKEYCTKHPEVRVWQM
jgi:thiamine biosynthesis lipoprotein